MTYDELIDAARRHAAIARIALDKQYAMDLWEKALDYQERAAKLGEKPCLGERPHGIDLESRSGTTAVPSR